MACLSRSVDSQRGSNLPRILFAKYVSPTRVDSDTGRYTVNNADCIKGKGKVYVRVNEIRKNLWHIEKFVLP